MSEQLMADISATCSSLGISDGVTYYPDPQCLESVRDLMRYLRRDDSTFAVRRQIGETQALVTDLLPILEKTFKEPEMYTNVMKLLVNLTNPALMLFKEAVPTDKDQYMQYMQIIGHLQLYKKAFADQGKKVWTIIKEKVIEILKIDSKERSEEDSAMIEHSLILLRNMLHVPSDRQMEHRTDNDASLHDELIWVLHVSGVLDLLVYLTNSEDEHIFYMHVIEIECWLLREQTPKLLAEAKVERSVEEKERDATELETIREAERVAKIEKLKSKVSGSRHSRFGGTLVVKDVKSIGDNDHIVHKPLNSLKDALQFDVDKKRKKIAKNRAPMQSDTSERRSAFSIRLLLREFCQEILVDSYNPLMKSVKRMLEHEASQENDETFYLWALKFYMEFNRYYDFKVELISETMTYQTFHYVFMRLDHNHQMMIVDKKKGRLWSKRLHTGLRAAKELLMSLQRMTVDRDATVRSSARQIESNIFYVPEYRESLVTLVLHFNVIKFSMAYLADLVEAVHTFIGLLKKYCLRSTHVVVQNKKKAKKKKKKTSKKSQQKTKSAPPVGNKEELWGEIGSEVSAILQEGRALAEIACPYDAASDESVDTQKGAAMRQIQAHLLAGAPESAISLLRSARHVWPENDSFGRVDIDSDEEFMALYDIFMATFAAPVSSAPSPPPESSADDSGNGSEADDEAESRGGSSESAFQFTDLISRFSHPAVMETYSLLLAKFDTNTVFTNHCVLKMLVRSSFEMKLPAMLYNVALLDTFRRILASKNRLHKPLIEFACVVVHRFRKAARQNPQVAVEALFWPTRDVAQMIEHNDYSEKPKEAGKKAWSEDDDNEIRQLFDEYNRLTPDSRDNLRMEDWIMQNMISQDRSKISVRKKLRDLGLLDASVKKSTSWDAEELEELKELYERYKDGNVLRDILKALAKKRTKKQIVGMLVTLGLVENEEALLPKKVAKSKNPLNEERDNDLIDSSSSSSSDEDSSWKMNLGEIRRAAKTVLEQSQDGFRTLSWLADEMEACCTERRDSDEESEDAVLFSNVEEIDLVLETPAAKLLCKALGLDQETFLKIPAARKPTDLHSMVTALRAVMNGEEEVDVAIDNTPALSRADEPSLIHSSSDDDSDRSTRVRGSQDRRRGSQHRDSSSSSSSDDDSSWKMNLGGIRRAAKTVLEQSQDGSRTVSWLADEMEACCTERRDSDEASEDAVLFSNVEEIDLVLETPAAKLLCKALGLDQETFLKIPAGIKSTDLHSMVTALRAVMSGGTLSPRVGASSNSAASSDNEQMQDLGKRTPSQKKSRKVIRIDSDSSDAESQSLHTRTSPETKSRGVNVISLDSDDSDERTSAPKKSRRVINLESDSSDNGNMEIDRHALLKESQVININGNHGYGEVTVELSTRTSQKISGKISSLDSEDSDPEVNSLGVNRVGRHDSDRESRQKKSRNIISLDSDSSDADSKAPDSPEITSRVINGVENHVALIEQTSRNKSRNIISLDSDGSDVESQVIDERTSREMHVSEPDMVEPQQLKKRVRLLGSSSDEDEPVAKKGVTSDD